MNDFQIKIKHAIGSFELNIECQIPSEGLTVVFGPSGCGKSTLLRCLAGLEKPRQADISFDSQIWQSDKAFIKAHRRRVVMVFQDDSLLPHLNVEENINYAIKRRKKVGQSIDELVSLFDLCELIKRFPESLSGGERQRVAMARALASAPDLMLMDEPMSALDDVRKTQLLGYLKKIKRQVPIIYVTHSRQEMMRLADHVVMMKQGRIVSSSEFWQMMQTQSELMMGESSILSVMNGEVSHIDVKHHLCQVNVKSSAMWVNKGDSVPGDKVRLLIDASNVSLSLSAPSDSSVLNVMAGTVVKISPFNTSQFRVDLVVEANEYVSALITGKSIALLKLQTGQKLYAQVKAVALLC